MNYIDQKYIGLLSSRFRNFKRKGPSLYNFSCPLCNDSETDTHKARGYLYDKKGSTFFFCHNLCGGLAFGTFLKRLDALLFQQWRLERLVSEGKAKEPVHEIDFSTKIKLSRFSKEPRKIFEQLPTIAQLPSTHEAKRICDSRKISEEWQKVFRYTPAFKEFTNSIIHGKFKHPQNDEDGRIIIPFLNKEGTLHAYQGRTISTSPKQLRYITIVVDDDIPCLWGLDRVDLSKPTYVTEGTLDAIFLNNSLAIAGGNFASLHNLQSRENIILAYDNEPRSKDTKSKMLEAVDQGFKVVIWPNSISSKDINDMIAKEGLTSDYIQYIIEKNTYEGLKAKASIIEWSKAK